STRTRPSSTSWNLRRTSPGNSISPTAAALRRASRSARITPVRALLCRAANPASSKIDSVDSLTMPSVSRYTSAHGADGMSCEVWSVGDVCETTAAFKVVQHQRNGPDVVHELRKGDKGEVRNILHEQPHSHWLIIFWRRLQQTIGVFE